jgi:uncharacterized protein YuzE
MKISYEAEVDVLYLRLIEGEHQCRTLKLSDEVALNIGKDELLVGIEILDAKKVVGAGNTPNVILDRIPFTVTTNLVESENHD